MTEQGTLCGTGLTPQEVVEELRDGAPLADIATEYDVRESDVQDIIDVHDLGPRAIDVPISQIKHEIEDEEWSVTEIADAHRVAKPVIKNIIDVHDLPTPDAVGTFYSTDHGRAAWQADPDCLQDTGSDSEPVQSPGPSPRTGGGEA